jgi:excisionase family DNA binding protein
MDRRKKRLVHTLMIVYIDGYKSMLNPNRIPPVKMAVNKRATPLLAQHQKVREEKESLTIDPLMPLREAVPMLGNPSYSLLRKWVKDGTLRCWRAGHGQYRVRLSEVQRFLTAHEVNP